jgi:4-cresol dehydrogenase (hydroxylating)
MRRLQLEGTVRGAPWFGNHHRLVAVIGQYPWVESESPPLGLAESHRIAAGYGIPPWTGAVGLYGTAAQVALARRRLRACLRGHVQRLRFIDRTSLSEAPISPRRMIELAMHRGYSGDLMNAIRRAYWRKRMTPAVDSDLDRDRVGFMFAVVSIPFTGEHVLRASGLAEQVITAHGFEPAINCHSVRERVLQVHVSIAYDRDIAGEDERILAGHEELAARWMDAGYFPFRLGLHSMSLLSRAEPSHLATIRAIKGALDPNAILAPGRYDGT